MEIKVIRKPTQGEAAHAITKFNFFDLSVTDFSTPEELEQFKRDTVDAVVGFIEGKLSLGEMADKCRCSCSAYIVGQPDLIYFYTYLQSRGVIEIR